MAGLASASHSPTVTPTGSSTNAYRLSAEARVETASGECAMDFAGINLTNVYRGLDNVVLIIRPEGGDGVEGRRGEGGQSREGLSAAGKIGGSVGPKALLVVSHYDSPVCSTGELR